MRTLFEQLFPEEQIKSYVPLTGGDINQVFRIHSSNGDFVVKLNSANRYPGMFELEKKGLEILNRSNTFRIPTPFSSGIRESYSFLIMEYLDPIKGEPYPDEIAGRLLAKMHKVSAPSFGLDHSNYIGSVPQVNTQFDDWPSFFMDSRINPMLDRTQSYFSSTELDRFKRLKERLPHFFPDHAPALLHGDLWSGNTFSDHNGQPVLIDPAVYFGHPLMDIGMTCLFGGFGPSFYRAYHEINPLEPNWEEAVELANLYPLLVHLHLFGRSYLPRIRAILSTYF